jgi:hypothetical protein
MWPTGEEASPHLRHFSCLVGRRQQRHVLPDDLLGGVPEQSLGRWVPTSNDPVDGHAKDRVTGTADNRVELTEGVLSLLAFGDVTHDDTDPNAAYEHPSRN